MDRPSRVAERHWTASRLPIVRIESVAVEAALNKPRVYGAQFTTRQNLQLPIGGHLLDNSRSWRASPSE
jgi:hypothetical protein